MRPVPWEENVLEVLAVAGVHADHAGTRRGVTTVAMIVVGADAARRLPDEGTIVDPSLPPIARVVVPVRLAFIFQYLHCMLIGRHLLGGEQIDVFSHRDLSGCAVRE